MENKINRKEIKNKLQNLKCSKNLEICFQLAVNFVRNQKKRSYIKIIVYVFAREPVVLFPTK